MILIIDKISSELSILTLSPSLALNSVVGCILWEIDSEICIQEVYLEVGLSELKPVGD